MPAIADASPLILLAKVRRLALLAELYGQVVIPPAVVNELQAKPDLTFPEVERFLRSPGFVRSPENDLLVRALAVDLGPGEAEAIALATEVPGALLIMDDSEGRRIARGLGLHVTGSLGVLIEAMRKRILDAVGE